MFVWIDFEVIRIYIDFYSLLIFTDLDNSYNFLNHNCMSLYRMLLEWLQSRNYSTKSFLGRKKFVLCLL